MITLSNTLVPEVGPGVSINVGKGSFWFGAVNYLLSLETNVALTANTTNYVFISTVSAAIQANTSGFPNACIPIATVITTNFGVYSLTDNRPDYFVLAGGGSIPNFSDQETPSGSVNGSNTTLTLAHTPSPSACLQLFQNGVMQQQGAGKDYTLATNTITFVSAPLTGAILEAWYRY